jgi:hypothetical protein
MKSWKVIVAAVAVVATVGLWLAAFLVWQPTGRGTEALDPVDGRSPGGSSASAASASSASPRVAEGATTSGTATGSGPSIETTSRTYFGRPFETIRIEGRYRGVRTPRTLRVEMRQAHRWRRFPLPAVTAPSGTFRAFLELGPGQYRVRLVDAEKDRASSTVTVLVF